MKRIALCLLTVAACGPSAPEVAPSALAPQPTAEAPSSPLEPLAAGPLSVEAAQVTRSGIAQTDWRSRVIYLVMTDRFFNGDPSNDEAGSPGCHDPNDPQKFHGGDFAGVQQKLPYLQALGVSAIWVTPAVRQIPRLGNGHCGYHGYWSDLTVPDDGQLEPKLGTPAQLHQLVAATKQAGMKFILDMVVNHTGDGARIRTQKPDWFHAQNGCGALGDPAVYCPLDGHPDFAQEKPEVAQYLDDQSAGWAATFALDGIRMDTARHVPRAFFRDHWFPAVHAVRPDLFTVGEAFLEGGANDLKPFLDAGFESVFNFPLRRALVNVFGHGGSTDEVARAVRDDLDVLGLDRTLNLVSFADNHDVRRFVNEPGLGVAEDEIQRRTFLALTAVFSLPGIPQVYAGDELGMYGGVDPDNRRDMPAWGFTAAGRGVRHPGEALPNPAAVFARYQRLIALRTSVPALIDGEYTELWRQNGAANPNVFAYGRRSGDSQVIVVINNGNGPVNVDLKAPGWLPANANLVEQLKERPTSLVLAGGRIKLSLAAKSSALYVRAP